MRNADGMVAPREDARALVDLARRIAAEAGRLLMDRPDVLALSQKSSPTDIVTQMDRSAEDLLVREILAVRPHDGILGEESGERPGSSGVRWVLDPLDGTTNYVYGLPFWSVSVGVEVDGAAVAGVVEAPVLRRTYYAVRGDGSWLEESGPEGAVVSTRLAASDVDSLSQALISTGFGYAPETRLRQAEDLRLIAPRVRDIRRLGAASLDLAWVAAGNTDAYFESGLKPWDLSAGQLIAQEAGALVTGLKGHHAGEEMTIAVAPGIASEFAALIERATGISPGA